MKPELQDYITPNDEEQPILQRSKKMTIYEIKERTKKKSPYFFTRNTLRFFGQTLKDFSVTKQGSFYRICAPMLDSQGKTMGYTVRLFNPITNNLEYTTDE